MKKLLFTLLFCAPAIAADPFREIGTITAMNAIGWDHSDTNVIGFNVFLSETNATNFAKVATVSTNRWNGDSTKAWFGQKIVYVTAFTARAGEESDPSEKVLVTFRAGVPIPPNNMQLYSLLVASATNALLPFPK